MNLRLYGGFSVMRALSSYGWLVALAVAVLALAIVYARPIPALIPATTEIHRVPASGIDGWPVAVFCNDPQTKVTYLPAPDASGATYQLVRVVNGVTESVIWTTGPDGESRTATHYYDSTVGQQSEPAVMNDDARRCVESRAR